ncbi:Methyltransferase-like protein 25 [Grifola frondosa]|uniref:Methyltransferase-like protein 25 n=1 Tax=Grifola frondosa TaxID=5627 RepID=A0A1C7M3C4_GRIFR|nr:Methyltransferase-like protein 25 [Grifola frondosa]
MLTASCTSSFVLPPAWGCWWDWAARSVYESEEGFSSRLLLRYYTQYSPGSRWDDQYSCIPLEIRIHYAPGAGGSASQMHECECLEALTEPAAHFQFKNDKLHGMSPKKSHEVLCMTEYTSRLLSTLPQLKSLRHVVDVGAGQVRLSLALEVLALDWSDVQTRGAARKDVSTQRKRRMDNPLCTAYDVTVVNDALIAEGENVAPRKNDTPENIPHENGRFQLTGTGSLTYKTINITTESLIEATDEWMSEQTRAEQKSGPTPLAFVALHACGSLTLHILRAFITSLKSDNSSKVWVPTLAIVVGCCYNLMDIKDFPLSSELSSPSLHIPTVTLTPNHLQLAAQIPSQWSRTDSALNAAKLAMKKVVWRALLEGILEQCKTAQPTVGNAPYRGVRRLGKLNDSAYTEWAIYLERAGAKLGMSLMQAGERDLRMERRLEVFHVLRCILGPVVETLILLDRHRWLEEELSGTGMDIKLVNLFDQASGSGRNIAITISPLSYQ